MSARLLAAGVRPISPIVDVTNYVLLELGQPMHAFDLDKLAGRSILVRRAAKGESIRTLDGVDRKLEPDMLVIADRDRAQAVAGVMGGAASEVSSPTRAIVFESACFNRPRFAARASGWD
jgi:phenylalanyl-tRNA synthetase beta chain